MIPPLEKVNPSDIIDPDYDDWDLIVCRCFYVNDNWVTIDVYQSYLVN